MQNTSTSVQDVETFRLSNPNDPLLLSLEETRALATIWKLKDYGAAHIPFLVRAQLIPGELRDSYFSFFSSNADQKRVAQLIWTTGTPALACLGCMLLLHYRAIDGVSSYASHFSFWAEIVGNLYAYIYFIRLASIRTGVRDAVESRIENICSIVHRSAGAAREKSDEADKLANDLQAEAI